MNTSKDYYAILGVLPSIEQTAIKAVYMALIKKYHPDVYSGDKSEAERITKDLNEAYSILGDVDKRKKYDEARHSEIKHENDYQPSDIDDDNYIDEDLESQWKILCEYFTEIEKLYFDLKKISNRLSFVFKVILVSQKLGSQATDLATLLKEDFLRRYFSENKIIQQFALRMIRENRKDVLLELNRIIQAFGTPTDRNASDVIAKISMKFNYFVTLFPRLDPKLFYVEKIYQSPIFDHSKKYGDGHFYSAELKNRNFISFIKNKNANSDLLGDYYLFDSKETFLSSHRNYFDQFWEITDQSQMAIHIKKYLKQLDQLGCFNIHT
jgi:curved DNA-binding protein CbpA